MPCRSDIRACGIGGCNVPGVVDGVGDTLAISVRHIIVEACFIQLGGHLLCIGCRCGTGGHQSLYLLEDFFFGVGISLLIVGSGSCLRLFKVFVAVGGRDEGIGSRVDGIDVCAVDSREQVCALLARNDVELRHGNDGLCIGLYVLQQHIEQRSLVLAVEQAEIVNAIGYRGLSTDGEFAIGSEIVGRGVNAQEECIHATLNQRSGA